MAVKIILRDTCKRYIIIPFRHLCVYKCTARKPTGRLENTCIKILFSIILNTIIKSYVCGLAAVDHHHFTVCVLYNCNNILVSMIFRNRKSLSPYVRSLFRDISSYLKMIRIRKGKSTTNRCQRNYLRYYNTMGM